MNKCCFCGVEITEFYLVSPFEFAEDEFPKPYLPMCGKCRQECVAGKRTKQEFVECYKSIGSFKDG